MNIIKVTSAELFTNVIKNDLQIEEINRRQRSLIENSSSNRLKNKELYQTQVSIILNKMIKKGISLSHQTKKLKTQPNLFHERNLSQQNSQFKSSYFRPKTCISIKNNRKLHNRTATSANYDKKMLKRNKDDFVMSMDLLNLQPKALQTNPKQNQKLKCDMKNDQQFLKSQQYIRMKNAFTRLICQKKQQQQKQVLRKMKRVANLRSIKFQPIWHIHRLN